MPAFAGIFVFRDPLQTSLWCVCVCTS